MGTSWSKKIPWRPFSWPIIYEVLIKLITWVFLGCGWSHSSGLRKWFDSGLFWGVAISSRPSNKTLFRFLELLLGRSGQGLSKPLILNKNVKYSKNRFLISFRSSLKGECDRCGSHVNLSSRKIWKFSISMSFRQVSTMKLTQ